MTNRANRRPSSTWASLCIYLPVYISVRLHALDSEPTGATMRLRATSRRMLVARGARSAQNCEMSCAEAARSRVPVYS